MVPGVPLLQEAGPAQVEPGEVPLAAQACPQEDHLDDIITIVESIQKLEKVSIYSWQWTKRKMLELLRDWGLGVGSGQEDNS